MSRQLTRCMTETEGHCCNCGAALPLARMTRGETPGSFRIEEFSKLSRLPIPEGQGWLSIEDWFDLCLICVKLERALIEQSGHKNHPERIAHYQRMREKYS